MKGQRGFTLIELMVAVAVAAMLMFAVIPDVSTWLRNTQIRNAAEAVQNGLQLARMEAMRRNENVTFWIVGQAGNAVVDNSCALTSTSGSWVVSLDNPAGACATAPSATAAPRIVEKHAAGDGARDVGVTALAADASAATSVTFNGFGQVATGGAPVARIDLRHANTDSRPLRVVISSGGIIRMCDPAVAAPDPRAC